MNARNRFEGATKIAGVLGIITTVFALISCILLGTGWQLAGCGLAVAAASWQLLEHWDKQTRDEALEKFVNMYS